MFDGRVVKCPENFIENSTNQIAPSHQVTVITTKSSIFDVHNNPIIKFEFRELGWLGLNAINSQHGHFYIYFNLTCFNWTKYHKKAKWILNKKSYVNTSTVEANRYKDDIVRRVSKRISNPRQSPKTEQEAPKCSLNRPYIKSTSEIICGSLSKQNIILSQHPEKSRFRGLKTRSRH